MSDDVQSITAEQAAAGLLGKFGFNPYVEYVLNVPPYTRYNWNGSALVPIGVSGAGVFGPYANTTALQTAKPAASNPGAFAYVGASAPYTQYLSDGSSWAPAPAPTFTFAALPAAASYIGNAFVSDVGAHGSLWRSDGSTWGIVGGVCVLGGNAVAKTVTAASTAEEVLEQITLPAGLLGLNGALRFTSIWTNTANANVKTPRARLGATALGGSVWFSPAFSANASNQNMPQVLRNRGVANSQVTWAPVNGGATTATGTAYSTFTEDTSASLIFAITGQKATGSDTLTLEGWTLELLRP